MDDFGDLLAVDATQTLQFFLSHLRNEVREKRVRSSELLYVASILAHYAQTSCYDTNEFLPAPKTLTDTFDHFVLHSSELRDSEILEIGGAQVLFLAGFFRNQMKGRHNVCWYDQIGQSFYNRAANYSKERSKRELLGRMARFLPFWTITCRNLNRKLQENQLLFKLRPTLNCP